MTSNNIGKVKVREQARPIIEHSCTLEKKRAWLTKPGKHGNTTFRIATP